MSGLIMVSGVGLNHDMRFSLMVSFDSLVKANTRHAFGVEFLRDESAMDVAEKLRMLANQIDAGDAAAAAIQRAKGPRPSRDDHIKWQDTPDGGRVTFLHSEGL